MKPPKTARNQVRGFREARSLAESGTLTLAFLTENKEQSLVDDEKAITEGQDDDEEEDQEVVNENMDD